MSAETSARPELRRSRDETLQHRQVGGAVGLQRQRLPRQIDGAGNVERGVVADQPETVEAQRRPLDGQLDRTLIAQPVVDQPEIELFDRCRDPQGVAVVELADDADRSAGHGRRVRRQVGLEHPHVRIERRVADAERQLGVALLVERNAAGARDGQPRRCRFELVGEELVAHRQASGDLRRRLRRRRTDPARRA